MAVFRQTFRPHLGRNSSSTPETERWGDQGLQVVRWTAKLKLKPPFQQHQWMVGPSSSPPDESSTGCHQEFSQAHGLRKDQGWWLCTLSSRQFVVKCGTTPSITSKCRR